METLRLYAKQANEDKKGGDKGEREKERENLCLCLCIYGCLKKVPGLQPRKNNGFNFWGPNVGQI